MLQDRCLAGVLVKPTNSVSSTRGKVISTEQTKVVDLSDWLLSLSMLGMSGTKGSHDVRRHCIKLSPTFTTSLGAETEATDNPDRSRAPNTSTCRHGVHGKGREVTASKLLGN